MKVNEILGEGLHLIEVLQFIHLELGIITWTSYIYTLIIYKIPFPTCARSTVVLPDTFSILLIMANQPEAAVQPNSIFLVLGIYLLSA